MENFKEMIKRMIRQMPLGKSNENYSIFLLST